MASTSGSLFRGTSAIADGATGTLWTDQRQFYIQPYQYAELWQSMTPFLSSVIERARVVTNLPDPLFKMFEHEEAGRKQEVTLAGTNTTSADTGCTGTITAVVGLPSDVITGSDIMENLILEVWNSTKTTKKGVVLCTLNNAGTYTFKSLKTAEITFVAGDIGVVIGSAYGEGSEAGEAWADDLKVVWGSTGIHRTPVEITGSLFQASLRGANKELARVRMSKLFEHKVQENKRLLRSVNLIGTNLTSADTFADKTRTGAANGTQTAGGRVRTPYGFISMIEDYGTSTESSDSQNIFYRQGGLSWNQFVDDAEKLFQYVNYDGMRDFFCGPAAFSFWSKLDPSSTAASRLKLGFDIRISDMKNTKADGMGINFRYLETPFGVARLIHDPALKFEYRNAMYSPSYANLYYAIYRNFVWKTAIKDDKFNGYDGLKDEYFNDTGVGATLIKAHAMYLLPTS